MGKPIGKLIMNITGLAATAALAGALISAPVAAQQHFDPERFGVLWPNTDFTQHSVPFEEIFSGGVPRDGIPPIYDPKSDTVEAVSPAFEPTEPVVTVVIEGEARAYPLGILMRHEIVNDELGGVPIAVTFCPLCNSAVVFDRRVDGEVNKFGVSGLLRHSDLVMWDHNTESWWQQFVGEGIVGEHTGTKLEMLPVRVESFAKFAERFPDGSVNVGSESFGGFNSVYLENPYIGYDQSGVAPAEQDRPFLFFGDLPEDEGIGPLTYVVAVGEEAWTIAALQDAGRVEHDDLVITWEPGQNSVMGERMISNGVDIGNVTVQRDDNGTMVDAVYDVTFAFAFNAFRPEGVIYQTAAAAPSGPLALLGLSTGMAALIGLVILLVVGFVSFRMFRKRAS